MFSVNIFLFFIFQFFYVNGLEVSDSKHGFDLNLYEEVLDPVLCEQQLEFVRNDAELLFQFIDAGARTPRGILKGNFLDLGNYYQCLEISEPTPESTVEGKYCMIELPLDQDINWPSLPALPNWPDFPWSELNPETRAISNKTLQKLKEYNIRKAEINTLVGSGNTDFRISGDSLLSSLTFKLAVCIPKVCSTQQAITSLLNLPSLEFQESYCRLPNDKQWVPADYVAIAVFGFLGVLIALSTAYDINYNIYQKRDLKKVNKLYQSFSIYNNTRRLVTYTPVPGALECLDGVRSFAMMWVIIGHTFVNQVSSDVMANPLDAYDWMMSVTSVWITAGPITVDTFFMIGGILLVYSTAGKMTSMKLLRNVHLFYLNRILRILPVLLAAILLQVSVLHKVTDGPYWSVALNQIHNCRVYWWSTLLHVQNFVNPGSMCLPHSWYLAIDMQLHIISPLVLFWVLKGRRMTAWIALVGALVAILTASTIFNFIKEFPSSTIPISRLTEQERYLYQYYVNTLTRSSPFFVGLIFGYLLHINRGKQVILSKVSSTILWLCAFIISLLIVYSSYPTMQVDWFNQVADSMINSFMRPAWAMSVGWMIFACVHGYGGPINWVLSLRAWKILGRLSYAMYIIHYPLIFLVNATVVAPVYFSAQFSLFKFLADFTLAVFVAFLLILVVDAPCSVLIKHFMGGGPRRPQEKKPEIGNDEKKIQYFDSKL